MFFQLRAAGISKPINGGIRALACGDTIKQNTQKNVVPGDVVHWLLCILCEFLQVSETRHFVLRT